MSPSMQQYKLKTMLHVIVFFLAFVIGDGLSGEPFCGQHKNYSVRKGCKFHKHVMCLLRNLVIPLGNVVF